MKKKILIPLVLLTIFISLYFAFFSKPNKESFLSTGNDFQSPKKVEDYFIETLKMKPEEAKRFADIGLSFYITKNTTLDGIISNLAYYGIVRDEKSLRYALEHTKDTTLGGDDAIKVGKDGTIDLAYYGLSRNMDTWQIAEALLNKPHPVGIDYNYIFMPGDPNAKYGPRQEE